MKEFNGQSRAGGGKCWEHHMENGEEAEMVGVQKGVLRKWGSMLEFAL